MLKCMSPPDSRRRARYSLFPLDSPTPLSPNSYCTRWRGDLRPSPTGSRAYSRSAATRRARASRSELARVLPVIRAARQRDSFGAYVAGAGERQYCGKTASAQWRPRAQDAVTARWLRGRGTVARQHRHVGLLCLPSWAPALPCDLVGPCIAAPAASVVVYCRNQTTPTVWLCHLSSCYLRTSCTKQRSSVRDVIMS